MSADRAARPNTRSEPARKCYGRSIQSSCSKPQESTLWSPGRQDHLGREDLRRRAGYASYGVSQSAAGETIEDILADFPTLKPEGMKQQSFLSREKGTAEAMPFIPASFFCDSASLW